MDAEGQDTQQPEGGEAVAVEAPPSDQQQHVPVEAGEAEEAVLEPERKSPLEPGGDRFKEVWARGKKAEERNRELEAQLQREREERIRLEERQKAAQQSTEKEYTWDELESFIDAGRITRAQAHAYKEQRIADRLEKKLQSEFDAKLTAHQRVSAIDADLSQYQRLVPAIMEPGTTERQKVEKEYAYLVNVLGRPRDKATELEAARAALGPVESLAAQVKARAATTQQRTTFMETATNKRPDQKPKDPVAQLDQRGKDHYLRMIKSGRYGQYNPRQGVTDAHWAKVREELTWERKR